MTITCNGCGADLSARQDHSAGCPDGRTIGKPTESTARHTPGPWAHGENPKAPASITGPDGALLGRRSEWKDEPEEAKANGDLMAAAPDLLAACKAFAEPGQPVSAHVIEQARAAIAKAEGTPQATDAGLDEQRAAVKSVAERYGAAAHGTERRLLRHALTLAVDFIENCTDEDPERQTKFFACREAWREAFAAADQPEYDKDEDDCDHGRASSAGYGPTVCDDCGKMMSPGRRPEDIPTPADAGPGKHYVVWVSGGHPRNGRRIAAGSSLEAREICAKAWRVDVRQLMARAD